MPILFTPEENPRLATPATSTAANHAGQGQHAPPRPPAHTQNTSIRQGHAVVAAAVAAPSESIDAPPPPARTQNTSICQEHAVGAAAAVAPPSESIDAPPPPTRTQNTSIHQEHAVATADVAAPSDSIEYVAAAAVAAAAPAERTEEVVASAVAAAPESSMKEVVVASVTPPERTEDIVAAAAVPAAESTTEDIVAAAVPASNPASESTEDDDEMPPLLPGDAYDDVSLGKEVVQEEAGAADCEDVDNWMSLERQDQDPNDENGDDDFDDEHQEKLRRANQEKRALIQEGYTVVVGNGTGSDTWKVVEGSTPVNYYDDYGNIGLKGVDFESLV